MVQVASSTGFIFIFLPFHASSLLNLCSLKNQDHLLKLTVSSLDYSRDGLARVILSKILTAATDVSSVQLSLLLTSTHMFYYSRCMTLFLSYYIWKRFLFLYSEKLNSYKCSFWICCELHTLYCICVQEIKSFK